MLAWLLTALSMAQTLCLTDGQSLPADFHHDELSYAEYRLEDHWIRVPHAAVRSECLGSLRVTEPSGELRTVHLGGSAALYAIPLPVGRNTQLTLLDGRAIFVEEGLVGEIADLPDGEPALVSSIALRADPYREPRERARDRRDLGLILGGAAVIGLVALGYGGYQAMRNADWGTFGISSG